MIDLSDPAAVEALMVRTHARRVAATYTGAGKLVPPGAAKILKVDTEAQWDADNDAYAAWCARHGLECIKVFGVTDFVEVKPARAA